MAQRDHPIQGLLVDLGVDVPQKMLRLTEQTQLFHFTKLETKRVSESVVAKVELRSKILRCPKPPVSQKSHHFL